MQWSRGSKQLFTVFSLTVTQRNYNWLTKTVKCLIIYTLTSCISLSNCWKKSFLTSLTNYKRIIAQMFIASTWFTNTSFHYLMFKTGFLCRWSIPNRRNGGDEQFLNTWTYNTVSTYWRVSAPKTAATKFTIANVIPRTIYNLVIIVFLLNFTSSWE